MDTLGKLFGSASKVRVMRLFLFSPETPFDKKAITKRANIKKSTSLTKITNELEKIKLIKTKTIYKKRKSPRKGKKKKKVKAWVLNKDFEYITPLHNLLIKKNLLDSKEIKKKLKGIGTLKLILISGVFLQEWESRVDILVVGDKIKKKKLRNSIKKIEAEIGKELTYAVFNTDEFNYRLGVYDKLIRDILDYPHTVVINKLELKIPRPNLAFPSTTT